MSDMEEYLFDEDYIATYGLMNYSNADFGFIYIETERDKDFWENFFGYDILKNYEINYSYKGSISNGGIRGKIRYKNNFKHANKRALIAIDSDFDHVTPNRFEYCKDLLNNPFVIHTFAYTKENIINSIEVIDDCLKKYHFCIPCRYRFNDFLSNYSSLIHDVFIKFVSTLDLGLNSDESILYEMVIPSDKELDQMFFDSNYTSFSEKLDLYKKELDKLLSGFNYKHVVDGFEEFGMNKSNVYQFIGGHHLERRIIDVIVVKIRRKLHKEAMDAFKAEGAKGDMLENRNKEISNHFEEMIRFSTLRANSLKFEQNKLYIASKKQLEIICS
ncbi:hypothetical protein ACSL9B_000122 [Vibrio cholerae]|nr:hypothetical protein [Vibrio cholerae]